MNPDSPTFIRYARHADDVMLWRCLKTVDEAFYMDVGALNPVIDSVTQAFYKRGWRGINSGPVPANAAILPPARSGDINLVAAVPDVAGSSTFIEVPGGGLSTFDGTSIQACREQGWEIREITVPTLTSAGICRRQAPAEIHFLKVDAAHIPCCSPCIGSGRPIRETKPE